MCYINDNIVKIDAIAFLENIPKKYLRVCGFSLFNKPSQAKIRRLRKPQNCKSSETSFIQLLYI